MIRIIQRFTQFRDGLVPKTGAAASGSYLDKDGTWTVPGSGSYVPLTRNIGSSGSITGGGNMTADRTVSLVNDNATPGNNMFYGTDATGVKGWYASGVSSTTTITGIYGLDGGGDLTTNRTLTLKNDSAAPGANMYYGTNASGVHGWYASSAGSTITITGVNSVAGGGDLSANRTLQLVNDSATPGNNYYYGTNGSGTKGWFAITSAPDTRLINTQYSITGGGDLSADRTHQLVNDVATPGNSKYYGTNGAGARGWFDLPTGDVNSSRAVNTQYSLTGGGDFTADRILSLVNDVSLPGNSKYYGTDASGTRGYFSLPSAGAPTLNDGGSAQTLIKSSAASTLYRLLAGSGFSLTQNTNDITLAPTEALIRSITSAGVITDYSFTWTNLSSALSNAGSAGKVFVGPGTINATGSFPSASWNLICADGFTLNGPTSSIGLFVNANNSITQNISGNAVINRADTNVGLIQSSSGSGTATIVNIRCKTFNDGTSGSVPSNARNNTINITCSKDCTVWFINGTTAGTLNVISPVVTTNYCRSTAATYTFNFTTPRIILGPDGNGLGHNSVTNTFNFYGSVYIDGTASSVSAGGTTAFNFYGQPYFNSTSNIAFLYGNSTCTCNFYGGAPKLYNGGVFQLHTSTANHTITMPVGEVFSYKYASVSHTFFQTAGITNAKNLPIRLKAKQAVLGVVAKTTTAFAITGGTAYTLGLGYSGTPAAYISAYNGLTAVSASNQQIYNGRAMVDAASDTVLTLTATSDVNLSNSTAGVVDIWVTVQQY